MEARFPLDPAPDVHRFPGDPDNCFDLINKYGTYNIQPTADADHLFPMIAPGMPRRWRSMRLDKHDLEKQE
ncbi:MAG: hypothetical protein IJL08_03290 [Oscillospiraceae bacterium]|jgi:hypothetical protein|nr:hypothetical protein [Oscillospiraceae bacterium]